MDQGKYEYMSLGKKYDDFTAPGFEVTLDGTPLTPDKYPIPELEVEVNADGTAGGCHFRVEGIFNAEQMKWENHLTKLVHPGSKIIVKGGYADGKKELFYGYVDDYSLSFDEESNPQVTVTGLDGLGYLMNMREPYYGGKKKMKAVIEELLKKSVDAGFAKSVKVTVSQDANNFEAPILKEQVDDWKFLRLMAQRCGASLLVIDGEMIFDTVATKTTPIIKLTLNKNVSDFQKRVSLAHQVGAVEVVGRDVNHKLIKSKVDSVGIGSDGKSAADWVPGLKQAVLREENEFVRTEKECEAIAQSRLNTIAMGLVSGSAQCIGLPELIPGRYVEIDGGDEGENGTYFLTKVRHTFAGNAFQTAFEFKGAKV